MEAHVPDWKPFAAAVVGPDPEETESERPVPLAETEVGGFWCPAA